MSAFLGSSDENLKTIEKSFPLISLHARGNEINIAGPSDEVKLANQLFTELIAVLRTGQGLSVETIERSIGMLRNESEIRPSSLLTADILTSRGKSIRPKTVNQKNYVDAIDKHTVVFGIGPAGSGKTYLAVAKAVQALQAKQVNRIVLTRPAVEAGEHLGFLPGTLSEKIDPYLRPLYDALQDMIDRSVILNPFTSSDLFYRVSDMFRDGRVTLLSQNGEQLSQVRRLLSSLFTKAETPRIINLKFLKITIP